MTGRYADDDLTLQVARTIRSTMHALNPEAVLVSEHFHDAGTDLAAGGWHANMNYSAFTRPVWTWLVDPGSDLGFLGMPVPIPRRDGVSMVDTMRDFDSTVPWAVTTPPVEHARLARHRAAADRRRHARARRAGRRPAVHLPRDARRCSRATRAG